MHIIFPTLAHKTKPSSLPTHYTDNVPCRRSKILCTADKFYVADQALVATGDNRAWHIEEFTKRFLNMSNAAHMPVVTAEVSSVPCHVQGCCTTLLSFRPGTTDMDVFRQVRVVVRWCGLCECGCKSHCYVLHAGVRAKLF